MNDELNQEAFDNPRPGDYWTERVFTPIFLVVRVKGEEITVLDASDRIIGETHWHFDYAKSKVVNKEWMEKLVKYWNVPGFAFDVKRGNSQMLQIVEEWKQYRRDTLIRELAEFDYHV